MALSDSPWSSSAIAGTRFDRDGLMTATARDLISLAFRNSGVVGVGQDPTAFDITDAHRMLNMMLAQWSRRRWLVYRLQDISCTATGAQTYTVGTACDFDVIRPDRLEGAYFRMSNSTPNPVDYELTLIQAREDYSRLALKLLNSFPSYAYYDPEYPVGKLYIWPVPSSQYQIHILVKQAIPQVVSLSDTIYMPAEYQELILWNLAERIRPTYQFPPDPQVSRFALETRNTLFKANTQIPLLEMPGALRKNNRYNIYSDRTS